VITALHALLYSEDPEATRAFFRDVVGWPYVDAHGGWLIFRTGPSELGVHPASAPDGWSTPVHHEVALLCDDIDETVAELRARGAEFAGEVAEQGFGRVAMLVVPGAGELILYQASHPTAHDL